MNANVVLLLITFCFVTSVTPGPNNMLLLFSGMRFGLKATIPLMLGVTLGHAFLVFCVGMWLSQLIKLYPLFFTLLKFASFLYIVYLAIKLANSKSVVDDNIKKTKPITFFQAAMFQWINPKGWMMAVGVMGGFLPKAYSISNVIFIALTFAMVNLPSVSIWAIFGNQLRNWMRNPKHIKPFNYVMAVLLIVSMLPMLFN